jgi:hypothetical protein
MWERISQDLTTFVLSENKSWIRVIQIYIFLNQWRHSFSLADKWWRAMNNTFPSKLVRTGTATYVLQFQIIDRFDFCRFVYIIMYLDIKYI